MEIKTGYLYHIKDVFFEKINDSSIMSKQKDVNLFFTDIDRIKSLMLEELEESELQTVA